MADDLKDLPAVPQGLDDGMRRLLASMREHIRNFRGYSGDKNTAAVTPSTATSLSTIVGPPGPPGPAGPAGTPYTPDYTAPPTPTGVSVVAGLTYLYFETDSPSFTVGHGYDRTIVYGAKWPTGSPAPTFSSAVQIHTFIGPVGSYPTDTGTRWAIWLTWRTNDAIESTAPEGGTNGHVITTGLIANSDLGPLVVQAGNLAAGAIDATKFVAAIEPITLYTSGSLPTTKSTSTIFYGGKLYRWNGSAYVTTVPTTDLTGTITSTQITDGAITTPKLFAGSVTTSTIAAHAVTANEIAANTITANELAAASVTAVKIAANAIAVGTAAIQNGAIVNAMIADATIDNAKIANLNASKITAGSLGVGSYIQSTTFTSGSVGWRIGADGVAEFNSVTIRGATYTGTIYANAGTIGGITIASGYMRAGQLGYDNGTGFHFGSDGRLSVGISTGNKIAFDGANLTIKAAGLTIESGSATYSGALSAATGSFAGSLSAATGTFSGTLTAAAVDAVNTVNIAGDAILVPIRAEYYLAPATNVYQAGFTAVTAPSVTFPGPGRVVIFLKWYVQGVVPTVTRYGGFRIYEDTTIVYDTGLISMPDTTRYAAEMFTIARSVASGTRTYSIWCYGSNGSANRAEQYMEMTLFSVKK